MPSMVYQSFLLKVLSQALSSQCLPGQTSVEVEAQSTGGEWCRVPLPWGLTLSSFPFVSFLLPSPQVLIFKGPHMDVANSVLIHINVPIQHVRNISCFGTVLQKAL